MRKQNQPRQRTGRRVVYISILALANSFLNFGFQLIIAFYFGADSGTDAFFLAFSIPEWMINITVFILPVSIIPAFTKVLDEKGTEAAANLGSSFITAGALALLVVSGAIAAFAQPIARISASSGLPGATSEVANHLRIMMPAVVTTSLTWMLNGLSYARDRFLIPSLSPLVQTIVMTLTLMVGQRALGMYAASIGFVLGSFAQFLLLFAVTPRGLRRLNLRLHGNGLRKVFALLAPLLVGNVILKSEVFVTRYLASLLSVGSVSYVFFGGRLIRVLARFASKGIATVSFPEQSRRYAAEDQTAFDRVFMTSLKAVLYLSTLVAIGLWTTGKDLIDLLFVRGEFSLADAESTYLATVAMLGVLIAFPLGDIVNNGFFSVHDTKSVTIVNLVWFLPVIVLKFLLQARLQLVGLSIASSVGALLITFSLLFLLHKKHRIGTGLDFRRTMATWISVTLVSTSVLWMIGRVLPPMSQFPNILVNGTLSLLAFGATVLLLDRNVRGAIVRRFSDR